MIEYIEEEGIVINKYDYGESDRYLTFFSKNYGKLVFFVKGIRKSKKRQINSADILNFSQIIFYKRNETYKLSSIQGIDSYLEIKEDLTRLESALYILSVLNAILVENNKKEKLFNLTRKTLDFLKTNDDKRKDYILILYYLYFVIKDEGMKIEINEGEYFIFPTSRFSDVEKSGFKLNSIQKEILKKLVEGRTKEIIKGKEKIKDIYKVILLLELYLNYQFGIKLNLKKYVMGVE